MNEPLFVTCPTCGNTHAWDRGNRFRPFCSERCKMIDLGRWANEEYRVGQCAEESHAEDSTPDIPLN